MLIENIFNCVKSRSIKFITISENIPETISFVMKV